MFTGIDFIMIRTTLFLIGSLLVSGELHTQESTPIERVANQSLTLPVNPPLSDFRLVSTFGSLRFTQPLGIVTAPGDTSRLFILEKATGIAVIPDLENPTREMFMNMTRLTDGNSLMTDSESGVLGLAFHPNYLENGYFYVFYTPGVRNESRQIERHNRVSRFELDPNNPNRGLLNTELVLFSQLDQAGNHNGGDIHFGPDGYLYVSLGDEGGANDQFNNARFIDKDLFAGILRIDVDKKPGNLPPNAHPAATDNYAIPADNPFIGLTSFNGSPVDPDEVRTEFWAVGLRNPWRMSFDPATGILYSGDVGQGQREEINIIEKGLDYGWSYREGTIEGPRSGAPRGLSFADPWIEYNHGSGLQQGRSVTGGVVYRGTTFAELFEHYIFADYVSGNIWAVDIKDPSPGPFRHLIGHGGIAGFGVDPRNGDVLLADLQQGVIWKLARQDTSSGSGIPTKLSETGAFENLQEFLPHDGIVPYEPSVPFWSDGALKSRWFSIPDPNTKIAFAQETPWQFPVGSVWIKHFDLQLDEDNPLSKRRLETRFIVKNEDHVYGVTYRWNEAQTDADLVPEEGMDETFEIRTADGATREQVWRYPGRGECLNCHTAASGGVLGFDSAQLNHEFDYPGHGRANQIEALKQADYFHNPPATLTGLPFLREIEDENVSLEYRVRSYLHSNCAQCHRPATGFGLFDARISKKTRDAGLIEGGLRNLLGDNSNRVIEPGNVDKSVLYQRMATRGHGQMPPIGSNEPDVAALDVLRRWIEEDLPNRQTYEEWAATHFPNPSEANALPEGDFDGDGSRNDAEHLAHTNPNDVSSVWKLEVDRSAENLKLNFNHPANRKVVLEQSLSIDSPSWSVVDFLDPLIQFPANPIDASLDLETLQDPPSAYFRLRLEEP